MALEHSVQCQIFELYIGGMTAYGISEKLNINYRTAKKYTERIDALLDKIRNAVAYCILQKIKENPEFLQE